MLLCLTLFLAICQCAASGSSSCVLNAIDPQRTYKEGDIIIGGIVPRHMFSIRFYSFFKKFVVPWNCMLATYDYLQNHMALIYAINQINRNPQMLLNLTLGYTMLDSCSNMLKALHSTMTILSEKGDPVPNYSCEKKRHFVGIIGDLSSATSYSIAQIMGIYKYPQISFGAFDPSFSDKMRFPSFYRTVPNELSFYDGIAQLLRYFGWTWVGIIVTEDDSGEQAVKHLTTAVAQSGGCIEFIHTLPTDLNAQSMKKQKMVFEAIRRSRAQVIILYSSGSSIDLTYTQETDFPHKIWISSIGMHLPVTFNMNVFNGSLAFSIKMGAINGFQQFMYDVTPSKYPDDVGLALLWEDIFNCSINEFDSSSLPLCTGNESFRNLDPALFEHSNARLTYSVYTAVYGLAHALHAMLSSEYWNISQELKPWKLNRFLQKIHFKTPGGDEIAFDDKGDLRAKYEILNWLYFPNNTVTSILVGSFDPFAPAGGQLVIDQSSIIWHPEGTNTHRIPHSVCSESCIPGFRKAPIEGRPICCFNCVPCAEGEFSNSTDMDTCLSCPEDQWPHERKDHCIQKTIAFLSYKDSLGMSLASIAIVFSITTAGILGLFLNQRQTPIVKANNQNLSYALLVSVTITFLCPLLFIGLPERLTCLIQQPAFGIMFTVAVSCILSKTITVVIAFHATKPGSTSSRWLGSKVSGSMVLLGTSGQVVICLSWLLTSPPYPDTDLVSETGVVILQCDPGSATAFYAVIGYMGLLALVSFIVAFLARNLPDRFNEARLITFSMLVFCSVWVSFIPAYLSTKGRYMVAVEIFAILASSAGLVSCIFIPKCYIILFRPDRNIREHLTLKK